MNVVEIYGLRIASTLALPGVRAGSSAASDLVVHVGISPPEALRWGSSVGAVRYESPRAGDAPPSLVVDEPGDGILRLTYAEGIRFHIARAGDAVWCEWRAPLTEADAITFLLGPVMGTVLRRRGLLALHASAVVIDGGAFALVGPSGSGKSTLAAAFARAGRAMLTEDVVALRRDGERWLVSPGYPGIRLWDEGAAIAARGTPLPTVTATWSKRALDLAVHGLPYAPAPAPLRGLLVLDDYLAPGLPARGERLAPAALLVELIANVYANYAASAGELARELADLRALAAGVPGWRFSPSHGAEGLSESCSAIESLVNRR